MFDRKINKFVLTNVLFNVNKTVCVNIPTGLVEKVPEGAELTNLQDDRNVVVFSDYKKAIVPIDNLKKTEVGDFVKNYKNFKLINKKTRVYYECTNPKSKNVKKYRTINYNIYTVEEVTKPANAEPEKKIDKAAAPITKGVGFKNKIALLAKNLGGGKNDGTATNTTTTATDTTTTATDTIKLEDLGNNKIKLIYGKEQYIICFKFCDINNTEQNLIVNINDDVKKMVKKTFNDMVKKAFKRIDASKNCINSNTIKKAIKNFESSDYNRVTCQKIYTSNKDIFIEFKLIPKNNAVGPQLTNLTIPPAQPSGVQPAQENGIPVPPPIPEVPKPIQCEQPTSNTPTVPAVPTGTNSEQPKHPQVDNPQVDNQQIPEQNQQDVQNDDKKKKKCGCYNRNKGKK